MTDDDQKCLRSLRTSPEDSCYLSVDLHAIPTVYIYNKPMSADKQYRPGQSSSSVVKRLTVGVYLGKAQRAK